MFATKFDFPLFRQDNILPHNFMAPLAFQEDVLVHEVFTEARQKPRSSKW